jgi:hypothetical protein
MLDPATVQVLFADLQPQIVARSKTNPPDALTRSAGVLAQVGSEWWRSRLWPPAPQVRRPP